MKYNIKINQKALMDNKLLDKLDMIDLALFDFIHDFFNSMQPGKITFEKDGIQYVEIRQSLISEQMPILKIGSRRTYINRMNNLIEAGLIIRYPDNQKDNRSGYSRGPNWDIFTFDGPCANNYTPCETDCTPCENICTPCAENCTPCENKCTPPVQNFAHNNSIIDNNIVVDNARTHEGADEAFVNTFLISEMANILCMQFKIGQTELKSAVHEILAQWEVSQKGHTDYTDRMNHLVSQLRIKLADGQRQQRTNTQSHGTTFKQQDRNNDIEQYKAALAEAAARGCNSSGVQQGGDDPGPYGNVI